MTTRALCNPTQTEPSAFRLAQNTARGLALLAALTLAACTTAPVIKPAPPPPYIGLAEVLDRPAEKALLEGIRAYEDGAHPQAEVALKAALAGALNGRRDRATAYKLLAFMACSSQRNAECEAMFRSAFDADPSFRLVRAEEGHPLWAPVYRRVLQER